MKLYGIYGAGGFGREIMPVARRQLEASGETDYRLVFIDDVVEKAPVNGYDVMRYAEFLAADAGRKFFSLSISNPADRRRLAEECLADGLSAFSLSAAESVSYEPNRIGEGAILCAYTVVTTNATIGRFFQANLHSYVAHDCRIGDFVTFAPRVHCNGNVVVEDDVYIGTGAIIRNGVPGGPPIVIGKGAVVGMGAVVTRDVAPGQTVVGNPARVLATRDHS